MKRGEERSIITELKMILDNANDVKNQKKSPINREKKPHHICTLTS